MIRSFQMPLVYALQNGKQFYPVPHAEMYVIESRSTRGVCFYHRLSVKCG